MRPYVVSILVGVQFLVCGLVSAQPKPETGYLPIIVDSSDRVMSNARTSALKEKKPALEFEYVKLYIKDYVDQHRLSTSQQIQLSSPDRFKGWLKEVAVRIGRPETELRHEIVECVAPNACPDLTSDQRRDSDYYKDRALEELRKKAPNKANIVSENQEPPPAHEQPITRVQPQVLQDDREQTPDTHDAVRAISATSTSSTASRIEIEILPAPSPKKRTQSSQSEE